ncbi:hypothetical protein [Brevibacterium litoralis]|uniref:hypothetical protein n=1 Tax=Brevibacterium litoralis TaxID=3138935 RepID=UPI0032EC05E4
MTPVTATVLTRAEAIARRAELERAMGNKDEFLRRAELYLLDADELDIYDEWDGLNYLLGE